MGRVIDADALLSEMEKYSDDTARSKNEYLFGMQQQLETCIELVEDATTVDAVEVVRCKDCKHRPTGLNRDDLEFPDDKCPCQCEDFWYNWKPADEWYCGNGERKDGEHEKAD